MDSKTYSAMQEEKPYSTYIKTVISRVYVSILDPFDESPSGIILFGDPKKGVESSMVDAWNEKQDKYIRKMNQPLFDDKLLRKHERPAEEVVVEKQLGDFSDEELLKVVKAPWYSLEKAVKETDNVPTLFRMLEIAQEAEVSEKRTGLIRDKISELQLEQ